MRRSRMITRQYLRLRIVLNFSISKGLFLTRDFEPARNREYHQKTSVFILTWKMVIFMVKPLPINYY